MFGRNGKRDPSSQQRNSGEVAKTKAAPEFSAGGDPVGVAKPYKAALEGVGNAVWNNAPLVLEAEVVPEMMAMLEGSYVVRLAKGVEFRALQVKLWLAGLHSVRAATMGGDLVLLSRRSGEDVGEPACKKEWWGDLLADLRTWSPNRVCNTRDIWLVLAGIPPHAWGEINFRKLTCSCGVFLELDSETRNSVRFDTARVKVRASICGRIDCTANLMIQGAKFVVRVVEEGGGLLRDDGAVEDQLRRSVVGSSCASAGQASVRAELEGLDDAVTDSDGSEQGQQVVHRDTEVDTRSKGYNQVFEPYVDKSDGVSEDVRVIPSMRERLIETDDNNNLGVQCEVRGLEVEGHVDGGEYVAMEENHVTSLVDLSSIPVDPAVGMGGSSNGPLDPSGAGLLLLDDEAGQGSNLGFVGDPINCQPKSPVEEIPTKNNLIDNFDQLLKDSRGKNGGDVSSNNSASISNTCSETHLPLSKFAKSSRAPTPFHPLLGPKCLRFAEAINNCNPIRKIKRSKGSVMSSLESQSLVSEGVSVTGGDGDGGDLAVDDGAAQLVVEQHHNSEGLNLSVCLPFQVATATNSGLHQLLDDDSINDVEGFIAARESPIVLKLEAQKLLNNQQELGFNFAQEKALPVNRMVSMEVRDREKMKADLESNGLQ
ncbi:hypothetical protein P8452_06395 [Trifolium repens]|nr:hypothetical protein P8452_06395 [Trifolium repens]